LNSGYQLAPPPVSASAQGLGRLGFGFGRRFFLLLGLGLAWAIPAFWVRQFLYGIAVWDGVLLVAWAIDLARLPRPRQITVERSWASAPGLGCGTQVKLTIHNAASVTIQSRLQDKFPRAWETNAEALRCTVPANGASEVTYTLRPRERGDHVVGPVYLRTQSALQMAERWYAAQAVQSVRVYPNLEAAKRNTIYLTRSRQIELEKRRLRMRGLGREFESLREYQDGDEVRDICWSATARRGKLVTKVFSIERSQAVWIVMDTGRLLRARVGDLSKLDYAADAALCLAQLALYSGDRVGILAYGRQIKQRVGLGRGPAHMRQILDQLAMIQTETPEADHLRAAGSLLNLQKRRSLVVWLTDLAETAMTPEVIQSASEIQGRNLVVFVAIGEPQLGSKASARPAAPLEMYETIAAQELVQRREILLARLREQGALAMEVLPGRLSAAVLNQYLHVKERSLL
jgi:uncharacterized protein (DUF58 family)